MRSKKILFGIAILSSALLIAACDGNAPSSPSTPTSSTPNLTSSTGTTSSVISPTSTTKPSSTTVTPSSTQTPSSSVIIPSNSSSTPSATRMEGKGTAADPYLIGNVHQLNDFAEHVNSGLSTTTTFYQLTNSIDMTDVEWKAVGTSDSPFTGYFSGNGHAIENLTFDSFETSQSFVGFFGYGTNARISDLSVTGLNIDLKVLGNKTSVYVGGVISYGTNVYIDSVDVNIDNFKIESYQNNGAQVMAGGIAACLSAEENSYVTVANSLVAGDIIFDMSNSADTISAAAGIVAMVSTSFGSGVLAINNCLFNGDINCGTYAAGIVADIDVYCSIVNSIAIGESITASDTEGSYAAGIVNGTSYETAIIGNYAGYKAISATKSSGLYKSYAADIVSLPTADGYSDDSAIRGTALFNNYSFTGMTCNADNVRKNGTSAEDNAALYTEKLGLSDKVWNLPFDATNPFVTDIQSYSVKVNFDTQYDGAVDSELTINAGDYNLTLAEKIVTDTYTRSGYSYYGYTYDAEGTIEARWYAPINSSITMYAGWASLAELIGNYAYVCIYFGNPIGQGGYFIITEENFIWMNNSSYEVYKYEYSFNGSYIFIGGSIGLVEGSYTGSVFSFNTDKTITGYDLNDSDAVYTGTRTSNTVVIPDYTDATYLGVWYSDTLKLTLHADGNAETIKYTSSASYYGGYRFANNSITLSVFGGYSNSNISYSESQDIMIGSDKTVFTREKPNAKFTTADNSVIVVVTNSKDYVIIDGVATDLEIEGGLADGSTVTIGGTTYFVNGTTLTVEIVEEEKLYVGTWEGKIGINNTTVVLNADGTATYNGTACTYTVSGNVITIELGGGSIILTLTYNESVDTISAHYEDDDYNEFDGSLTRVVSVDPEPEPEPVGPTVESVAGTYSGVWGSANVACSIVLKSDKTGVLTAGDTVINFTWNVDANGKITTVVTSVVSGSDFDDLALTYVSKDGVVTITGSIVQDYDYTMTISVTRQGEEPSDPEEPTVAPYVGTWKGKIGMNNTTVVLNADGTATYNGTACTYTVSGNVITIELGGGSIILTLTYNESADTISAHYEDDDYNEFSGTLTR